MKRFTLCTAKYETVLQEFTAKAAAAEIIYIDNTENIGQSLSFMIARRETFHEMLLKLLMDIAENENPVYKHSENLRKMARDLRSSPTFERELLLLGEFTAATRQLNLEGYVTFRMCEFREKLDLMIYSLVKKIKFCKED